MSQQNRTTKMDLQTDGRFVCYDRRKLADTTVSVRPLEDGDIGLVVSAEDAMTTLRIEKGEMTELCQMMSKVAPESDERDTD